MTYNKKYFDENKERILAANRQSYERNREKRLATIKKYRESDKEKYNAIRREWYANNKEKKQKTARKWRLANRDIEKTATLKWRKANPEKWAAQLERNRIANIRLCAEKKQEILNYYGAKCNCCGLTDIRFLTVDHVEYGKHNRMSKKERRRVGINVYRQVIREGFPKRFQILCMNCNWAKGVYGKCPHELERTEISSSQ